MTPIINHCVMPKDGVSVKATNTTPSDITFTGLTAGVKYHVSVVCYMLSTSGDNPRLRLTTNGSDSGLVSSNCRVDYVFTAASTTHGILVGLNGCTVNQQGLVRASRPVAAARLVGIAGQLFRWRHHAKRLNDFKEM